MTPTSLQAARAAYLWRLQRDLTTFDERLVDLRRAFAAVLEGDRAGRTAAPLDEARAAFVAQLDAVPDVDDRIPHLAHVFGRLLADERRRRQATAGLAARHEPPAA
jgi:hypothetical protein